MMPEMKALKNAGYLFSQRDPRWKDIPLGVGGGQTIGSAGCIVACAAGGLSTFSDATDPGVLNRWLCRNGGFVDGNRFVFDSLQSLGLNASVIDCHSKPAPMDEVAKAMNDGAMVIAKLDFYPGGEIQQHWVRFLKLNDFGRDAQDVLIHDPWMPPHTHPYLLMPRYGHYTWEGLSRAIFTLLIYHPKLPAVPKDLHATDDRVADLFHYVGAER